ncbi:PREDICTED: sperm flagellar protein 1-like [Ceratosolen solmsi marchali]|uniref:Sperm flagellar protein 1-like n=1 Tax=Ceratosolen solmsi marchali TaxID=326594 RepID=A0AAJ7DXS8_9HYME|nr:PREDICTED: sperm flagellar protein 1-like [Ceratosolen solmsi marchali]
MTITQELYKDGHISDKSDNISVYSENPARIEDIFEWVDGLPLSKTTKNLARDFSDAVLMSEILKYYYPGLVTKHNYIPASGVFLKKENWNTLNRKVLSKIDLTLSPETIDQLAHSQVGVIDKILADFREKQMLRKKVGNSGAEVTPTDDSDAEITTVKQLPSHQKYLCTRMYHGIKNFFGTIFGILLSIICFWKWFSSKQMTLKKVTTIPSKIQPEGENSSAKERNLRKSYTQALQDLRMKSEMIKTLCYKISFLEGALKFKNIKITTLTSQLKQNTPETFSPFISKINTTSTNITKPRRRPRTQI